MKRLPLLMSFLAAMALSASLAFWSLQLIKAPQRPIVAAPLAGAPELTADAANGLFGGRSVVALVSNYQLKGVVAPRAGSEGVAILVADGKPPQAVPVGREIAPGVTLKEVHPKHVLLSEGGVMKRVELASDGGVKGEAGAALTLSAPDNPGSTPIASPGQPPTPARMTVAPTIMVPAPAAGSDNTR